MSAIEIRSSRNAQEIKQTEEVQWRTWNADDLMVGFSLAYVFRHEADWFLYVVEAADSSFYTGIARDVERRVQQHNAGKGAKYTAMRRPVKLVAVWKTYGRSSALKLEYAFKQLTRPQKAQFIEDKQANFRDAVRVF